MSNYYCLACGARIIIYDDELAECTGCGQQWDNEEDDDFWQSISFGPNFKT